MAKHVSPEQFGQLPLFMATDDVVKNLWKGDAFRWGRNETPQTQWEEGSGAPSLRERKTARLSTVGRGGTKEEFYEKADSEGRLPPVTVLHHTGGPSLIDGHHRLAWAQKTGRQWLPTEHEVEDR